MPSSRNIGLQSFFLSLVLFFIVSLLYYIGSVAKTDNHYIYPIDDAYIHLAMAKNFALHDIWGITKYQFSSTSSSPLFTLIISSLITVFGNNDQIPLYFNIVFSVGIIYFLSIYYAEVFNNIKKTTFAVVFTLFFAVLHLQMLSGMEHTLQVFLFVVNIFCFYHWDKNKYAILGFYVSILLMGLVRFESMFYFVILAFVLMLIKKWKEAAGILILGFLPILLFCYFNYQQDGYFFPNSVVVKGTKLGLDSNFLSQLKIIMVDNFIFNISFYKVGVFPVLLCAVFLYRDLRTKTIKESIDNNFFLIVLSLLMICHTMFADLKGLFRYEAYLLTGFSMVLIPKIKGVFFGFKNYLKKEKLITLLIVMNIVLFFYKGWMAHRMLENGGKNIYEQQIQSAHFLHTYYNSSKVVANDIGAITYYTDIHLLDIAGLASTEMIPFNENKKLFDDKFKDFLTKYGSENKYELAIVYDIWLQGYVPENWKKAATLTIKNRVTVAREEVSVYSIDTANLESLKRNIRNFKWNKNVEVKIVD
ncbi:hypothetical protein [Chryseobacterium paridis]|uniref:Glycosyltransferase RgtA/B/C/D-like domain-containing protein n=1 Tax=Chryseobacterium paridis TaxID=2800328 RepID=A0ABS1FPK3_9FLAO|nr:hypothetical protein [Chryseobacterium paridis]MBK1894340.1 hypothetical protein [Chryseobacterium paridis]